MGKDILVANCDKHNEVKGIRQGVYPTDNDHVSFGSTECPILKGLTVWMKATDWPTEERARFINTCLNASCAHNSGTPRV